MNDPATPDGKPDDRDRDAWLQLAVLGPGDVDAARQLWLVHAPKSFADLPIGQHGYHWDSDLMQYVANDGHKVKSNDLKALALLFALMLSRQLHAGAASMARGETPIDQWQRQTAYTVKDLHIAQAALASGGFDKLDGAALARVSGSPGTPPGLAYSLDKLWSFARNVDEAAPRASTISAIASRAELYGAASNGTFEDAKRFTHISSIDPLGGLRFKWERNILGSEDPCEDGEFTDGCEELTEAGWQPIGSMSLPGTRTCAANCKCTMDYSFMGPHLRNNSMWKAAELPPVDHWVTIDGLPIPITSPGGDSDLGKSGGIQWEKPKWFDGRKHAIVYVSPGKLLAHIRATQPAHYVGPGGVGESAKPGAYEGVARHVQNGGKLSPPEVYYDPDREEAHVKDGRHRLAYAHDHHAAAIPVIVNRGGAASMRRRFGIKR